MYMTDVWNPGHLEVKPAIWKMCSLLQRTPHDPAAMMRHATSIILYTVSHMTDQETTAPYSVVRHWCYALRRWLFDSRSISSRSSIGSTPFAVTEQDELLCNS